MELYIIFTIVLVCAAVVVFLIAAIKKQKENKKPESGSAQKIGIGFFNKDKSVTDLIPIKKYDKRNDMYILNDGTNMDILQIQTKDLITSSESEVEYDCMKFGKLYKVYGADIKIVALNFPCNTYKQQQYLRTKLEKSSNSVFEHFLNTKLDELAWLEKNNTTREFYLFYFSQNVEDKEKNLTNILTILSTGRDGLIKRIPAEKKHQILFKINNKNSMVNVS